MNVAYLLQFLIPVIVYSCKPLVRDIYIDDISLLSSDENALLLHIKNDKDDTSFCKILNVLSGELTDKISCNDQANDILKWMNGVIDPTSTKIMNISSNNSTLHRIFMQRNDEIFGVSLTNMDVIDIVNKYNDIYPIHSWTFSYIYTTFIVLTSNGYNVIDNLIAIKFVDSNNNNIDNIYKVNISQQFEWMELGTINETIINVFEDYQVIQYPLQCCICSTFAASYYNITKMNDIDDILEMDLITINDGRIDTRNGRIYDIFLFATSITIYDATTNYQIGETFDLESQLSNAVHIKCSIASIVIVIILLNV